MRILVDIGHPAHIHYFKNFIHVMRLKGHQFLITARNRENVFKLASAYGIDVLNRGKGAKNPIGKILYMILTDIILLMRARKFRPDLYLHFGSVYPSHVSRVLGGADIIFDDTENARLNQRLYVPFTDLICTPSCFHTDFGKKQIYFDGYMELCYLHPNRFVPDSRVLKLLGVNENDPFAILRFVGWEASHDYGHTGLYIEMKRKAVKEFSRHAKVFISSEKELPEDLKQYQLSIPPEMIHSVLYYATLLYGESATMASECAVLGTPAIYIDNDGRGYTDEEESVYGLVYNFTESTADQEASIQKGLALLQTPDVKNIWKAKRDHMLKEKIDVTAFMVWLVENYPESARIMKQDPEYQRKFL